MSEPSVFDDPRIELALKELEGVVRDRYPEAQFSVVRGEDPDGIYLKAVVDVDDTDDVYELVIDRLMDIQINQGLPVYFIPLLPIEKSARIMREQMQLRDPVGLVTSKL